MATQTFSEATKTDTIRHGIIVNGQKSYHKTVTTKPVAINLNLIRRGDERETMRLIFALDPQAVRDAFMKIGYDQMNSSADMEKLITLHKTGWDTNGGFRTKKDNKPYRFNAYEICQNVKIRHTDTPLRHAVIKNAITLV